MSYFLPGHGFVEVGDVVEQFRVSPEALTDAGNQIGEHGETLHVLHQSSHGEAAGAHAGWVGSSAGALSGLLGSWEATGAAHFQRIGGHSADMHIAAAEFHLSDQRHRQAFDDVDAARGPRPGAP